MEEPVHHRSTEAQLQAQLQGQIEAQHQAKVQAQRQTKIGTDEIETVEIGTVEIETVEIETVNTETRVDVKPEAKPKPRNRPLRNLPTSAPAEIVKGARMGAGWAILEVR